MIEVAEIEIYGNNNEFEENEYDVYANDSSYGCEEFYTVTGLEKARAKAKALSKKYNVPVKENI